MSRFSVDINEVSSSRSLIPVNDYPIYFTKGSMKAGSTDKGPYIMLNFQAVVKDEEVAKLLGIDEPKCFPSIFVRLKEDFSLDKENNQDFKKFCDALGFKNLSDFEDGAEDCTTQEEYNAIMYKNLAEACQGNTVLAKIAVRTYEGENQNYVKSFAPMPE